MKMSNAFPSKYLKASDILEPRQVTITKVEMDNVGDDSGNKPVAYFNEEAKGLVLNVTNARQIAKLYGDETESWTGKAITIFATTTDFRGDIVDCIRVRPPADQPATESENPKDF